LKQYTTTLEAELRNNTFSLRILQVAGSEHDVYTWHRICISLSRKKFRQNPKKKSNGRRSIFIMAEENSTGNNLIWAITTIIIVALIAGALYYSGFLGGTKRQKVDVEITTPSR